MPMYAYRCKSCGTETTELRPMRRRNSAAKCPQCGGKASRDRPAEQVKGEKDWCHSVLSDRMGVHPNQVLEHRRRFPKIPMNDDGQIVVTNAAEERRINKELAYAFRPE